MAGVAGSHLRCRHSARGAWLGDGLAPRADRDLLSLPTEDDAIDRKALCGLDCIPVLDVLGLFGG